MENLDKNTMCSQDITELAKAMLKVQKTLKPASKDNYNVFTKSKYATLASVMESCRDALVEAGIWVTQYPVNLNDNSLIGLVTKLVHAESGQWQASLLTLPIAKNDPQGYGSALTYARRYGLSALVGIVTEDDDGNSACQNSQNQAGTLTTLPSAKKPSQIRKSASSRKNSASQKSKIANQTKPNILDLPHIDGVNFNQVTDGNGGQFITATGETRSKKEILKAAGFTWDVDQKMWWKAAS